MNTPLSNEDRTPLDVLRESREYIKRGWCQRALAKNSLGDRICGNQAGAREWCALGAIGAALNLGHPAHTGLGVVCINALADLLPPAGYWNGDAIGTVVDFNNADDTKQADVLNLFDRALYAQRGYDFARFRAASLTA